MSPDFVISLTQCFVYPCAWWAPIQFCYGIKAH